MQSKLCPLDSWRPRESIRYKVCNSSQKALLTAIPLFVIPQVPALTLISRVFAFWTQAAPRAASLAFTVRNASQHLSSPQFVSLVLSRQSSSTTSSHRTPVTPYSDSVHDVAGTHTSCFPGDLQEDGREQRGHWQPWCEDSVLGPRLSPRHWRGRTQTTRSQRISRCLQAR